MMKILLSILIPTVEGREKEFLKLKECLSDQVYNSKVDIFDDNGNTVFREWGVLSEVEILIYKDNKTITIGEKRERMYQLAKGKYSWQIDDDDLISENAIELILNAIKQELDMDCITFEEHIDIDGKIEKSNHSLYYGDWEGQGGKELWDGFHYHRTPFFKSVIKTEIARSIPIPHIRFGEDHQWAQALKLHLKNEIHIDEQLYKYIHHSSPFNQRYGISN